MATVNGGKGLYDNEGICEKGILLCNAAMKDLVSGQYIAFADKMAQVVKIFANLKAGIKADSESYQQNIETLKNANNALQKQIDEKEGVVNVGNSGELRDQSGM